LLHSIEIAIMTCLPKIYFVGDLHGRFTHLYHLVERVKPDAIILLGDLEARRPLDVELQPILAKTIVRFIHGNHDTDSPTLYQHVFQSSLAHWNLHGRIEEICGIRIAGLGGVFRGRIWMPPAAPAHLSYQAFFGALDDKRPSRERNLARPVSSTQERLHCSSIFPATMQTLARQTADVLVTHEAPSCHPNGFAAIDDLAQRMGVKALFHGHHHQHCVYRRHWHRLGFRAYGVSLHGLMPLGDHDLEGVPGGPRSGTATLSSQASSRVISSGVVYAVSCQHSL
jgi:predicted phosphodiesterase